MDGPFRSAAERAATEAEATRLFLKARASEADADWDEALGWVSQNPAHGYAFAKVEACWDLAARLREVPPERLDHPLDGGEDGPHAFVADPAQHAQLPGPFGTRRVMIGALAASVVAIAGTIALQLDRTVDRYRTGVGEERAVRLGDGSVVHLNTATSIEVALGERRRSVRLLRGEASFDVAADKARPFVVDAQGATLRAVGTAFNVRLRPDMTEVTVTHGVVAVRDGATAERPIGARSTAAIRQGAIAVTSLDQAEIVRRLAWQHRRLTFNGDTLAQAVEDFNRYRTTPIVIGDPALSGVRIGGTFRTDRSDEFARALEQSFAIRAVSASDGSLLLVQAER